MCSSVSVIFLVLNSFVVIVRFALAPVDSVACIVSPCRLCHCEYEGLASHYTGCSVVVPSWLHNLHFQVNMRVVVLVVSVYLLPDLSFQHFR